MLPATPVVLATHAKTDNILTCNCIIDGRLAATDHQDSGVLIPRKHVSGSAISPQYQRTQMQSSLFSLIIICSGSGIYLAMSSLLSPW